MQDIKQIEERIRLLEQSPLDLTACFKFSYPQIQGLLDESLGELGLASGHAEILLWAAQICYLHREPKMELDDTVSAAQVNANISNLAEIFAKSPSMESARQVLRSDMDLFLLERLGGMFAALHGEGAALGIFVFLAALDQVFKGDLTQDSK